MRRTLLCLALVFLLAPAAYAALHFPALTGRVVDEATILSSSARQELEQTLEAYEKQTTDQIVVVTLRSLQGTSIEDYGYQLGRAWGIGQKGKNNGVLLIVAPKERKVRIEVGYGLEGVLTDALSSSIIQNVILPEFRAGHMERGVMQGAQALLKALDKQYSPPKSDKTAKSAKDNDDGMLILWALFLYLLFSILFIRACSHGSYGRGRNAGGFWFGNGLGGGSSGGGGGGFRGGGGSFGGGGASGGW